MASVKVTVNVEVDGEPLKGFPYTRRFEPVDRESFDATIATGAPFITLPSSGQVGIFQFMFFQALGAVMAVKMRAAGDTAFTLNKGGFVIVVDSTDLAGTLIQNNSGAGAKAVGMLAGT